VLSILFIYFIGKAFYSLADEHAKNKWLYAVLGVLSYYGGAVIGGIILILTYVLVSGNLDSLENGEFEKPYLNFILIPIGLLTCWIFYRILKSFWSKRSSPPAENEVLDANLLNDNTNL
jgi:hypothetical protein